MSSRRFNRNLTGIRSWGRRRLLDSRGGRFESFIPDMAKEKYVVDSKIRLTKVIMGLRVRPNTIGQITKIKGGGFGAKEYHIRFEGLSHDVIMKGDRHFVPLAN